MNDSLNGVVKILWQFEYFVNRINRRFHEHAMQKLTKHFCILRVCTFGKMEDHIKVEQAKNDFSLFFQNQGQTNTICYFICYKYY